MNILVLFTTVLSCFFTVSASNIAKVEEKLAETVKKIESGDFVTMEKYCNDIGFLLSAHLSREADEKCDKFLSLSMLSPWEKKHRECRKVAECGYGDMTTCTQEILLECKDYKNWRIQQECIDSTKSLKTIESMSNWLGPVKYIFVGLQSSSTQIYCGDTRMKFEIE
jgi:hypothetical protein